MTLRTSPVYDAGGVYATSDELCSTKADVWTRSMGGAASAGVSMAVSGQRMRKHVLCLNMEGMIVDIGVRIVRKC